MTGFGRSKVTKLAGVSIAVLMVVSTLGLAAAVLAGVPTASGAAALAGPTSALAQSGPRAHLPAALPAVPEAASSLSAAPLEPAVAVPDSTPTAGDGNDWYADAPTGDVIGVVTGSFPAEAGVTGEVANLGPGGGPPNGGPACPVGTSNCYGLQINTNEFPTTYASSGGPISTSGSEQYVYQDAGTSAFMGIWVILYGFTTCPNPSPSGFSAWDLLLGNCYAHTPFVSVPAVPVTDLANVTMTAYANQSGSDALVFCVNPAISGWPVCTSTSGSDAIGLSEAWTVAEFNVLGDNGGSQATFNGGAALQVQTQIAADGGAPLVPTCAGAPGVHTVENNNLYLWPCSASSTGILFWEANESFGLSASPGSATVQAGQSASYTVGFTSFAGVPAPVQLSVVSSLPAGVTASFPVTVTPPSTGLLTLTTSSATPLGDYAVTVESEIAALVGGSSPGPIATTTVLLHVFNFTVSIAPGSATVARGSPATYAVQLALDPGSTVVGVPPILLAGVGLPADASTSGFSPSGYVLNSPTPTTVPFVVFTAAAPSGSLGDFAFVITGTAEGYPAGEASAAAGLHIFDFTVSLSPATASLGQGASATMDVSVGLVAGSTTFDLPGVSLALTGLPGGVVAVGFPASLGIGSSQTFTLETAGVGHYVSCPQVSTHGGQNLKGADLAHCNLAGYDLKLDNLQKANLSYANLVNASLVGADLQGATLAGANTVGTNFFGANLAGADLSSATAIGKFTLTATGTADGISRSGSATLTVLGDRISGDNFQLANLYEADLYGDVAVDTQFQAADLWEADLADTGLAGASFVLANLQASDLVGANLNGTDFAWANLYEADLYGDVGVGANFEFADLVQADLAASNFAASEFRYVNAQGADFAGADLVNTDFQYANLAFSDLAGANLTGANLHGANLWGANLTGTTF